MPSSSIGEMSTFFPFSATLVLVVVLLFLVYYIMKDRSLPPGPIGSPYFGYWPFLKENSCHLQLQEMQKKYGETFSFRFLGRLYINLGSVNAIREAHLTKSECFAGRYSDFNILNYMLGNGVAFLNGEPWKVLRKFFFKLFKEYGLSSLKVDISGTVHENLNATIEELKFKKGESFNATDLFMKKCSNIMQGLMFSDDGISNKEIQKLNESYGITFRLMTSYTFLLHGRFARYVIFPQAYGFPDLKNNLKIIENIMHKIIKRHESSFDENNIRDIIDNYIMEKKERISKGDSNAKHFTNEALLSSLIQFVGDGALTLAAFISLFLHALIEYPEEQDKIYAELLDVVGSDRQPTVEDRNYLPYTNAFLLEVMRYTDFFPIFPSLECSMETTLSGYRIPKGAITLMNLWTAQHDPEVYEEPYTFNPSRYISAPGKQKPELPLMFGVGKRACAGEGFSMMLTFLFVTTIVKNFRITLRDGHVGKVASFFMHEKIEICAHPRTDH